MSIFKRTVIAAFLSALVVTPALSEARRMSGREIGQLFIGQSSTWNNFVPMAGRNVEMFTTPSGKLLMRVPSGVVISDYSIDFDGGQFCNGGGACMDVYDTGNGDYPLVYNGQTLATVTNAGKGDRLGLFAQYAREKEMSDRKRAETFALYMKMLPVFIDAMGGLGSSGSTGGGAIQRGMERDYDRHINR